MRVKAGGGKQAEDDADPEGDDTWPGSDLNHVAEFDGCDDECNEEDIDHAPSAGEFDEVVERGLMFFMKGGRWEAEQKQPDEFDERDDDAAEDDNDTDEQVPVGHKTDGPGPDTGLVSMPELFKLHDRECDREGIDNERSESESSTPCVTARVAVSAEGGVAAFAACALCGAEGRDLLDESAAGAAHECVAGCIGGGTHAKRLYWFKGCEVSANIEVSV